MPYVHSLVVKFLPQVETKQLPSKAPLLHAQADFPEHENMKKITYDANHLTERITKEIK